MCFTDDYDCTYSHSTHRRARKRHRCDECNGHIEPGEPYEYMTSVFDGRWDDFKLCDRCIHIRALIYAHERGEGCFDSESYYPVGDGQMRDYAEQHLHWRWPSTHAMIAGVGDDVANKLSAGGR